MKILGIAAHPDDLEYGCFGTLNKYYNEGAELYYLVLTDGADGGNPTHRRHEQLSTASKLGAVVKFGNLPSALLNNNSGRETIKIIEESIACIEPDIIFSHTSNDHHQDHRLVNAATISATRFFNGDLYFYEGYSSLKEFKPNVVFNIDKYFKNKLDTLRLFDTQASKFYMDPEIIISIAIFRAAQFGFIGKAEAFELGGMKR